MKRFSLYRFHRPVRWAVVAALAVALVWVFAPLSQKAQAVSTHTPWQNMTQSQLTAVWWKWVLSIHVKGSPLFDDTGANAFSGQPYSDLLFLGGTFTITQLQNGDQVGKVTRSISVKQGTAFFFPLLNSEADNVCGRPHLGGNCFQVMQFPHSFGVPKLRAMVAALQDPATGLHSTLTPTDKQFKPTGPTDNVGYARLQSPPSRSHCRRLTTSTNPSELTSAAPSHPRSRTAITRLSAVLWRRAITCCNSGGRSQSTTM
jgi:hypothetical protein